MRRLYTSSVTRIELWPSLSCTTFEWTSSFSSEDARVWRQPQHRQMGAAQLLHLFGQTDAFKRFGLAQLSLTFVVDPKETVHATVQAHDVVHPTQVADEIGSFAFAG